MPTDLQNSLTIDCAGLATARLDHMVWWLGGFNYAWKGACKSSCPDGHEKAHAIHEDG